MGVIEVSMCVEPCIMLYYVSLICLVSLSHSNSAMVDSIKEVVWNYPITSDSSSTPVTVGVNEGLMMNPFTNATSVSCGSKVDTLQAVIGARLRLNCGLPYLCQRCYRSSSLLLWIEET